MRIKLRALTERESPGLHPHLGRPFHMTGRDLPAQYHGGPVEVKDVDPARLQLRDKGTHGRGFYTTSSHELARDYAKNNLRRDRSNGVVTVKHADPSANVLVAHEVEDHSHPDLVKAVKEFNPKYAKTGDMGIGDMTWRNQVNKFAEHHGYDAVRFQGATPNLDHVVWKNHSKLRHSGLKEDAAPKKRKFTPSADPEKRARQKEYIKAYWAKKRESEEWARGDAEEKAWLASQKHESAEMTCVGCDHSKGSHKLGVCGDCKSMGTKYHDFMKAQYYSDKPVDLGLPKRKAKRKVVEAIVTCKGCKRGVHTDDGKCMHCGKEIKESTPKFRIVPLGEKKEEGFGGGLKRGHDKQLATQIPKHEISGHELGEFVHGSTHNVKEFHPKRLQANDSGFFGKGLYGTKDRVSAKTYGKNTITRKMQPNARVLRYHRLVSKNQPEFVQKVADHAKQHGVKMFDGIEGRHRKLEHFEIDHASKHDTADYMPQAWDHMVTHYADHHNYDAVHIIHHTYGNKKISRAEYPEQDEVRVRNLHALAGPEAQQKLPGLERHFNYTLPPTRTVTAARTASGKAIILKKHKRKEHDFNTSF